MEDLGIDDRRDLIAAALVLAESQDEEGNVETSSMLEELADALAEELDKNELLEARVASAEAASRTAEFNFNKLMSGS